MTVVIITFLVIVIDQLTKFLVNANMEVGDSFNVIPGLLNFSYITNDGAAWGMFDDKRWVFLILSTVAIAAIIFILIKYKDLHIMMEVPLALILGGGIGNMIDRLLYTEQLLEGQCTLFGKGYNFMDGVVIDFIEAAFIDFPIFNIADCAVTVGTALLFIYIIFIDPKLEKEKKAALEKEGNSETETNEVSQNTKDGEDREQ